MRVAKLVQLNADDDRRLRILSNRKRIEARVQMRARIVLLAAAGMSDKDIAQKLLTDRRVAARWRARFLAAGVEGLLQDAARPGRPRTARKAANVEEVVRITLEETPQGATHWSTRTLAEHLGTNASAVARIWRAHGLKPHRIESFKLSNDPRFTEKLEDIVGLYLDPPEHALVLCCDEKTQIQALDRTQPGLPLKRGRGTTMTHDYKRNGVTTLFAALNVLTGTVLSMTDQLHRHQEWLRFLKTIEQQDAQEEGTAPHRRQLCDPQAPRGACLAGQAPEISHALHADQFLVAQHGRALLSRYHRQAHPPRCVQERARSEGGH